MGKNLIDLRRNIGLILFFVLSTWEEMAIFGKIFMNGKLVKTHILNRALHCSPEFKIIFVIIF